MSNLYDKTLRQLHTHGVVVAILNFTVSHSLFTTHYLGTYEILVTSALLQSCS